MTNQCIKWKQMMLRVQCVIETCLDPGDGHVLKDEGADEERQVVRIRVKRRVQGATQRTVDVL